MTLMTISRNITQDDLSCRFCVDQSSVSCTLTQWIPMLASTLGGLIVWPQHAQDQPIPHTIFFHRWY